MIFADRKSSLAAILAVTACSAASLMLSACESTGGARFASVGSPGAGSGGGSGGQSGGTGSETGGGSGTGGSGSGGSGSGSGGGAGSGSGGGSGGGSSGASGALGQLSPVLTTAGNAVLAVSDAQGNVTTPVATALPITQPVTGTITRILDDAGTVLVDAGQGRTLLLQGAQGVVGDVLSIDVGGRTVTTGLDGTSGAIGLGVLGDTQPTGTLASAGVLNAGNTALATVNGVADVRITNITSPTGGIASNLLNVALGGNSLIGNGDPALINANVLPGGAGGVSGGALAPVTSTVSSVVGTAGNLVAGATPAVENVTSTALGPIGVAAGAGAGGTAEAGAGAAVSPGGVLAPVTGTVTNTVTGTLNTVGGALNLNR
ncbi:hypothetical protein [Sphingobium sp. Sx8-8]|uniref:hypothetical protein n=1 Tax=Sphingobium sp. Sx8-8 TaxID=2933617 RepID=UPI001F56DD99|nr:hypothetical protein [Sphingobium sp. Sx8-8]